MLYGNLRAENMVLKMNPCKSKIFDIKFLNFGSLSSIEDSEIMNIPDQIEHMPPDLIQHLIESMRFNNNSENPAKIERMRENVKYL